MSRQLSYAVIADGGTDRALIPIIDWAIHRHDPGVEILEPEFRKRKGSIGDFLDSYTTGAMIVFVHRDAENIPWADRRAEFAEVRRPNVVPVIPVRMTESWLLIDKAAVSVSAGRPSATVDLPPVNQLESLANPKQVLEDALLKAAGSLTGRRLKQFHNSIPERRVNVASRISDFSPLERLSSFQQFQSELRSKYPYRF